MASETGNNIFARARVIASQTATDAHQSSIIDSLGGLRALLIHSIREIYRRQSNDQKFIKDTVTRHTVTIAGGEGDCPDTVMREFLGQADVTDDNNSLVSYLNYGADYSSGVNFTQLGYLTLQGDTFLYTAPAPSLSDYDGNLYVSVASFPELPAQMTSAITFPSESTIDSVVLFLAMAISGKEGYHVITTQ